MNSPTREDTTLSLPYSGHVVYDSGRSLEAERWESTVAGTEGIDMCIGVGFFADADSSAIVHLLGPEMVRSQYR